MERALRKRGSLSTEIAISNQPFREKRDQAGREVRGRDFRGSWSRWRAWGCEAQGFRSKDKSVFNSCPRIGCKRGIATSFIAPVDEVSMDSHLAAVALGGDLLATTGSVEAEHDQLSMKLNPY